MRLVTKHDKIPDTQFGFFPSRSTLHLLFILVEAHCTCFLSWQKHTAPAFYPGRSTLHPLFILAEAPCTNLLFILQYLRDAAQKRQRGSSRPYTAFIDFKQAYDLISRSKMWDHLPDAYPHAVNPIMLMNTRCWMGMNQRLSSHFLV